MGAAAMGSRRSRDEEEELEGWPRREMETANFGDERRVI
jgi:hypothetical protein